MPSDSREHSTPSPALGSMAGKYRLLALAGQGGMGVVWKAEDTSLRRTVALKLLPEALANTADARRRFLRGARAASQLTHPALATVFEVGELGAVPYIAIEWIEGETLADLVARGPLAVVEALRIARDAADALAHAHDHGVLHRDVSARNIMVRRGGEVVILDFGLALPEGTSRITSSTATMGTVPYLAPEIVLGRESTPQSDIYGLGVVLYEMLTGSTPFRGERAEAMLYAIVNLEAERPTRRQPGIPAALEAVVLRAIAREPKDRFASARAMADALRALDADAATRIRPAVRSAARAAPQPATPRGTMPRSVTPAVIARYVAVLPFRNLLAADAGGEGERFALGVTDTVGAQLARYPGIIVVPAGALSAEVSDAQLRDIARSSGADLILRGTIQHAGARLRIAFSLLDPLEGLQIAGDVVDGASDEVFLLQDLLTRSVAEAIHPGTASVTALPQRSGLEAVAAQERYLQAIGYLQRFDNEAQVDGALTLLTALRDGGNDSAMVEAALGRACLYKYQITHDREWEERAEQACGRALELDPRTAEAHVTLGNLERVSGRFADAIRSFRHALKLRSDHPEALAGLAQAFEAAGKTTEAEETFLRALALRPAFWEGYHRLGGLYFNQGRYEQALELWRRVVELTPDNARAHYNCGGALFRLERFEEAIAAFNRSIEIRPEATAYSNLGTLHYFLGHWRESAGMFEKAVALRENLPRLRGNLGDAYRWIPGREADAARAYDEAIRLVRGELEVNPKHAESLGWLAEWLARRGDLRGATQTVRRALKLTPDDVNGMARAVNVFHLAGDREEALRWLKAALEAGYGLAEFERDPDLKPLRADVRYLELIETFQAAQRGRPEGSPADGESGRSTQRGDVA